MGVPFEMPLTYPLVAQNYESGVEGIVWTRAIET